jgi:hypothetical protein
MTNQQHPITPPPELVQQWTSWACEMDDQSWNCMATWAAQWGADQELQAVCQILFSDPSASYTLSEIRAARRPKPPSLKEQALADFDWLVGRTLGRPEFDERSERIRRALEQLPE